MAILVDLALCAFVLFARSSAPGPVMPMELIGALAIAVAYGTPAIAAAVALRGRRPLFVAAGLIAAALSATSFSLITLVLLPPAVLFLASAGGPRSERTGVIPAILVLPAIVGLLVCGFVALVWVAPIGLAGAAFALLAGHATAARSGTGAARIVGGTALVVGLAAAAWLLPITHTTTICWTSSGAPAARSAGPSGGPGGIGSVGSGGVAPLESGTQGIRVDTGGTVTVGPVGPGESSGCDGGVPMIQASALSLVMSGICALAGLVVFPRTPNLPGA